MVVGVIRRRKNQSKSRCLSANVFCIDIGNTLSDLWILNRETNIWTEIKRVNKSDFSNDINFNPYEKNWPSAVKDFSLIKYSKVKTNLY